MLENNWKGNRGISRSFIYNTCFIFVGNPYIIGAAARHVELDSKLKYNAIMFFLLL